MYPDQQRTLELNDTQVHRGSSVEVVQSQQAVGQVTIARTVSLGGPEMFSLCLWRELTPPSRVVWE